MNVQIEYQNNDEFVARVSGRVDTTNADEFYQQIVDGWQQAKGRRLVLSLAELEYISSAGLRSIVRLSKQGPIKIVDVAPSVMDVFDMTGFSEILDIQKRIREVVVDKSQLIGEGANGAVYRLDRETVVKLYPQGTPLTVVDTERELARKSFVHGINTAITFDMVQCDGCYGTVFELVDAHMLSDTLASQPELFDTYAPKYVETYRGFHTTEVAPDEFPSIKKIYQGYIDGCVDWYSPAELDQLRAVVDSVPDRNTLLHGDYHANNIMVADGELLLIDMGDVSYGHPIFDFLATAATQANLVELDPAYAEHHTHMPVASIKRLWSYLLEHYFDDKTPAEVAAIDQQIRLFSKLKVAMCPVVALGAPRQIIEASVNDAKANFLPRTDELIGSLDW